MKFETKNLVIFDNPNLNNLIVPVGFFLNNDDNGNDNDNNDNDNSNMNLLNYISKNSSVIDDNLYDKLFNLVDNNKLNNKTKKNNIKKSKTKKNNKKKKKNKKTKRHIKLK